MDNNDQKSGGVNGSVGIATPTSQIPTIGQVCEVKAWFVTVQLACNCGAHETVLIAGKLGASGQCPACKKFFIVQGMTTPPGSTVVNFKISVAISGNDQQ